MNMISHRGLWRACGDANSREAFVRAWASGFGVETDIRDRLGDLVVAHDPAYPADLSIDVLFSLYRRLGRGYPLALNIKADGLQESLKKKLEEYSITNYFVFDMSVPQALDYARAGFAVFTRHSELEEHPAFYDLAVGVWMDAFFTDWISEEQIARHCSRGKRVCIVSPELHGRPHRALWEKLRSMTSIRDIALCTDFPQEAREYFHGQDPSRDL